MGGDAIKIISMHSAKRGMEGLPPKGQSSYLQQLLEGASPHICFMPDDNNMCLGQNVVVGYEQYRTPGQNQTVLLYDSKRVTMERPKVNFSTFGYLEGLDVEKLVSPMVQVNSLNPVKSIVKEFAMISWQRGLFSLEFDETRDLKVLKSLVVFSQRFAASTNSPIFLGGEIPLRFNSVQSVVKDCTKECNIEFLKNAQEGLGPQGYLPSMTSGATTSLRHKFKLEVFRCKSNFTLPEPEISDCFIASKELQITEAKMMNVEDVLGKKIEMKTLKEYAPVQTEIKYENRPPRHHGG